MNKALALELITDCIRNVSTLPIIKIEMNSTLESVGILTVQLNDFIDEIRKAIVRSDYRIQRALLADISSDTTVQELATVLQQAFSKDRSISYKLLKWLAIFTAAGVAASALPPKSVPPVMRVRLPLPLPYSLLGELSPRKLPASGNSANCVVAADCTPACIHSPTPWPPTHS